MEATLSREYIGVSTDAAVTILVSTEGCVKRLVTPTAHGLIVSAPTHTPAGDVKRLNIQEPVKTLLKTEFRHLENTSF